jgi:hypothetical protein
MMASFLFSTRMHERYMFPVVGLSLVLCVFCARYWSLALVATLAVFANVYLSLTWGWGNGQTDLPPIPMLDRDLVPRVLSLATMVMLAVLATYGCRTVRVRWTSVVHAGRERGRSSERFGEERT